MAELGLDMLKPINWIPQTWEDSLGCLGVLIGTAVFACLMCIPFSFVKKSYCAKCGYEVQQCSQHYCPICGHPTDSVNWYNYWERPNDPNEK